VQYDLRQGDICLKLYIKQKVFSWKDKFTIKDADGNDRYYVEGEAFSWGHKLHVLDLAQREVAFVRQRVFSWLPKYEVYVDDVLQVTVIKEFAFFKSRYSLVGVDWEVNGDFWEHNYMIQNRAGTIASISKAWFTWGDSYEVDLMDGVNEVLAIATVLAIDCVLADAQTASSAST
jgi:uncharacterized protein YxjI